jgi:hypothetical protein
MSSIDLTSHAAPSTSQFFHRNRHVLGGARADENLVLLRAKRSGDGKSDSAGGPGDEGDPLSLM